MRTHHVCLVESSLLFHSALTSMLHRMGFAVTKPEEQATGRHRKPPDVFLIDIATCTENRQELEELVARCSRVAPVLLLARDNRIEQVISGLKAGAVGFVRQTSSTTQLRKAILAVAGGNTWCDKELFRRVMKYLPSVSHLREPILTKREMEVLNLICHGESNKEIAAQLGLTEQSIKVYVSNLFKKTGASNRSNLTVYAITRGLVGAQ